MPTPRVSRGAFKRSCRSCGWQAIYATKGMANSRKKRHRCETHLRTLARAHNAIHQYDALDRTPQPCHHPVADHQHGTYACYTLDKCRCALCAQAQSDYETNRTRQHAYGRWDNLVDADPARAHMAVLAEYGISLKQVSRLTGVSNGSLSKLVYGHYKAVVGPQRGKYGTGDLVRGPSARITKETAERVLAVEVKPENIAASALDRHRTDEARIKLRSLMRIGWSMSRIGTRLGMKHARNAGLLIHGDQPMMRRTVDGALALFDELCMTPFTGADRFERRAASQAARYAQERGWAAPLELDDLGSDETEHDGIDHAAVERCFQLDPVPLNPAERAALRVRWLAAGRPLSDLTRLTGITKPERYRSALTPL